MTEQTNIPKPASPLPWTICREVPGYSDESHILQDKCHYKVAMHLRLTAAWPADLAYIVWAANNALKLYEALEDIVEHANTIAPTMPSATRMIANRALKAARGEA